jgi:hypothetical protein
VKYRHHYNIICKIDIAKLEILSYLYPYPNWQDGVSEIKFRDKIINVFNINITPPYYNYTCILLSSRVLLDEKTI